MVTKDKNNESLYLPSFLNEERFDSFVEQNMASLTEANKRWEEMKKVVAKKSDIDLEKALENSANHFNKTGHLSAAVVLMCSAIEHELSSRIDGMLTNPS